jgi:hypothetical protein
MSFGGVIPLRQMTYKESDAKTHRASNVSAVSVTFHNVLLSRDNETQQCVTMSEADCTTKNRLSIPNPGSI